MLNAKYVVMILPNYCIYFYHLSKTQHLVMVLFEVLLVLLKSEVVIVKITALPEVAVPATDAAPSVSTFLLGLETGLAVVLADFAPNHLVHRLRLTGRNLAVLGSDPLLEESSP